jgi:hypothetical protein
MSHEIWSEVGGAPVVSRTPRPEEDIVERKGGISTGVGWTCRKIGRFRGMVSPESRSFSWLSLGTELTIRCFAATGCLDHEKKPPVEDEVRIPLDPPRQEPAGEEAQQEGLEQG